MKTLISFMDCVYFDYLKKNIGTGELYRNLMK